MLESVRELFRRADATFSSVSRSTALLDAITWPREVESRFFERGAAELPSVTYEVDRDVAEKNLVALADFERSIDGPEACVALLKGFASSYAAANEMLLAVGTRRFFEVARETYGSARSVAFDADSTNLDFAEHLARRLAIPMAEHDDASTLSAEEFKEEVERRLARRKKAPEVSVELSDKIASKAIAGQTRLRIRRDARFDPEEARGLYHHEIETHVFTAQNGAAQPLLGFLRAGGPRSTRTQEGVAVFAEFFSQALTSDRLRRLVDRVRLVAMAEDGADFLQLYRFLLERGRDERAAFVDASRVCRGGLVSGGAPFPKDACYLAGFMEVYNFLRVAIAANRPQIAELLVAGRFALEDVPALVWLSSEGLLVRPPYLPLWVKRRDDLLTHFAFTSFLEEVDLAATRSRFEAALASYDTRPAD